jgi:hypothetical protein
MGIGVLIPDGSPLRTPALAAGLAAGATAWVAVPVRFCQVGSWLNRDDVP